MVLNSLYLDQLISRFRHIGMGCHMNGLFTGVFIYADDITLLAPSRASLALETSALHPSIPDESYLEVVN